MNIIVKRFCHVCDKVTKWKIEPNGKYWERHTCAECKNYTEFKTT